MVSSVSLIAALSAAAVTSRRECSAVPQLLCYQHLQLCLRLQPVHCAGIGMATADVASDRLPGWEEHSYGYHGDDGHSFCGSGQGRKYGPTYSTGTQLAFSQFALK